ncbi:MAG: bifunctional nuclease family protein [Candidatus Eremiobacteraeota bacterium]|nr:bifunctional nuclease family protein [Candidatus Eremiobacteraeota bacterium]
MGSPTIPHESGILQRARSAARPTRPWAKAYGGEAARESPRRVGYVRHMRQMKVDKLGIDLLTHDPVVILKDMEGSHYLPILIGPFEATAIALALEGAPVPRPLSHDLMRNILDSLNANLEQVVIHDIKDSTFFAKLIVRTNGELQEIDARPSDGIALALRVPAPIFVSDKIVLEEATAEKKPVNDTEMARFKKFLEDLKPSDFNR